MKKIGIALTAFVLCLVWAATALAASVTATGQGATERDALHAAMREAIEQKIGVRVDSRTYVENYRVIHDRISPELAENLERMLPKSGEKFIPEAGEIKTPQVQ